MDFSVFRFDDNDRLYPHARIEYFLNEKHINCCAFEQKDTVSLRLYLPRALSTISCKIEFYQENQITPYKEVKLDFIDVAYGEDI